MKIFSTPRPGWVLLVTALIVVPGCGPTENRSLLKKSGTNASNVPKSANGGGTSEPEMSGSKWDRLAAQVPNAQAQQDQALNLLRDARDLYDQSKKKEGAEAEQLRKEAGRKYAEAGTVYDVLFEQVADLDEKLWDRKFNSFQRKWDKVSKPLKRLNF